MRIFLIAACLTSALMAAAITERNWLNHPKIREVRRIYNKIQAAKKKGRLRVEKKTYPYCHPPTDQKRVLYRDSRGNVAQLTVHRGSDDSATSIENYYDTNSKLRFVFITGGAVNGTQFSHRVYLSKSKKIIWEKYKKLKGPGYPFPRKWPKSNLIHAPAKYMRSKRVCK